MTTFNLIPRPDLETVDLEEELLVFDPIQENSHIFNQTAAQIWRLLAARTPVTDLVDYLVDHHGLPDREEIQQTVQDTLSRLERLGLVIPTETASLSSGESNGPPAAPPLDPDKTEKLFLEAGRLVKKGRIDQAEGVLAPIRSPAFESPGALSNQGVSEILLGRWTEAEKPLERAYALDPDNPEIAFNLSSLRYHQGRADEALALLTRREAGDPDNVHRLCLTGKVLTALNRLDEAREKLTQALAVDPGFLNIHTDLALVCLLQNRLEEAEDRLQAALRLGGSSPEAYRLLGHLQFMRRDMEGALAHYHQSLALAPGDWLTRYNLSIVHFHLRSWSQTITEAEQCLENNPDYLPAYELLARTHQARGDRPQAFLVYLRARVYAAHFSEEVFPLLNAQAREAARRGEAGA